MLANRRQRHAVQRAVRREHHQLLQRRGVEHLRLRVLARRRQQRAVRRLHQRGDLRAVRADRLRDFARLRAQHAELAVRAAAGEEGRGELREDDLAVVGAPESRENVYGGGADVEEDRVLALEVLHAV